MANWTSLRIGDFIEEIEKEQVVPPVVQRNLVGEKAGSI
jgi:hypothetical protein